jgi:hypothetical protein
MFDEQTVHWHLSGFTSREAADAARSATGRVVEEGARVWPSEFGRKSRAHGAGAAIATIGPMKLSPAHDYTVSLPFAVMRPTDRSRVRTHPGPAARCVLAGEQCLETAAGATAARAGESMGVSSRAGRAAPSNRVVRWRARVSTEHGPHAMDRRVVDQQHACRTPGRDRHHLVVYP